MGEEGMSDKIKSVPGGPHGPAPAYVLGQAHCTYLC